MGQAWVGIPRGASSEPRIAPLLRSHYSLIDMTSVSRTLSRPCLHQGWMMSSSLATIASGVNVDTMSEPVTWAPGTSQCLEPIHANARHIQTACRAVSIECATCGDMPINFISLPTVNLAHSIFPLTLMTPSVA